MASIGRERRALAMLAMVVAASSAGRAEAAITPPPQPASITVGLTSGTIARDGMTAVMATLLNADGSAFTGSVTVQFSSTCQQTGTAAMDTGVAARNGIAASTYIPNGCAGVDQITAKVGTGTTTVQGVVNLLISGTRSLSPKASLGRAMFFDKGLSAAGNVACSTCHAPAGLWSRTDGPAIPLGGVSGTASGFRTTLSAAYAAVAPPFRPPSVTSTGLVGPRGGLMWDGRASTVVEQARGPLLAAHEMANANSAAVLTKLLSRPYLASFKAVYGSVTAGSNPDVVLTNIVDAISTFEKAEKSFAPFNSKYDAVQSGLAAFTAQETRGQALFFDRTKGACAGCHDSRGAAQTTSSPQLFTDSSYRVLAVPRNWAIPYNNDAIAASALASVGQSALLNGATLGAPGHAYYDLGFCGPIRSDFSTWTTLCGSFRVPGLRNTAMKTAYEHNGVFGSLAQVIDFYVNRDITPQRFYVKADGSPDIAYNDLPVVYQGNRDIRPPFTPVSTGPRLSQGDVQDLIAFLCTLTDGFDPQQPQGYARPAQCRAAVRP